MELIIIGIIALAMFIIFIFIKPKHSNPNIITLHPIKSIRPEGTMGFEIGDTYDYCTYRLNFLGITIDNDDVQNDELRNAMGMEYGCVSFGIQSHYDYIREVLLMFDNKKLHHITIRLENCYSIMESMMILSELSPCIADTPVSIMEEEGIGWGFTHTTINLLKLVIDNEIDFSLHIIPR